jgi:uncharacterized protein (TIGR02996 family)
MVMHAGLLADVAAHVDDDGPRLVCADWLEDNGDPDRAELIRAQCRLAAMGPCDPDRYGLEADVAELLEKHAKRWLKPLAKIGTRVEFARGFPHRIALPVGKFVAQGEAALAAAPTLREYRPLQHASGCDDFLKCPTLGRFTSLDFRSTRIGAARAVALANSPHIANLRSLNLGSAGIRAQGAWALAFSPFLANLRRLNLHGNGLIDLTVERLATAPGLAGLTSLDLSSTFVRAAGIAGLARSPMAPRLQELVISEINAGDNEARAFAAGEWASLRKLTLHLGLMSEAGMATLATCAFLSGLRELNLEPDTQQSSAVLLTSPHLARLELLDLPRRCHPGSLEALAGSPMLANLRGLRVQVPEADGIGAVLRSPASAGLVELQVTDYGDRHAAVARHVAEAGHLTGLRKLAVLGPLSGMTPGGLWVADLLAAEHLAGLVELDLSSHLLAEAALQALVESPHLKRVRRLRLRRTKLSLKWKDALVERFGERVVTVGW